MKQQDVEHKASSKISLQFQHCLYTACSKIFAGSAAFSFATFSLLYNIFTMTYFVGLKNCKITKTSNAALYAFIVASLVAIPGAVVQLQRYYNTICEFFGITHSAHLKADKPSAITRYLLSPASFSFQVGLMGLNGANYVSALYACDTTTQKISPCEIKMSSTGWQYKLGAGVFLIFCAINHQLIIYGVRKKPLVLNNLSTAIAWSIASFVGMLFGTIEPLLAKFKHEQPFDNNDIRHIIILALSAAILLPYRTYTNYQEYKSKQTPYSHLAIDNDITEFINSPPPFTSLLSRRLSEHLRLIVPAGIVAASVWYMCITGMEVIFLMYGFEQDYVINSIISSGILASTGYMIRFLHHRVRPEICEV